LEKRHRQKKGREHVKRTGKKTDAMSGLKMVGGAAAGAAAGSLMGPIGAAVGAVAGGIAGANAREIAESKPVKTLAAATRKRVAKALTKTGIKGAGTKATVKKTQAKKASAKSAATRKNAKRKK